MTRSWMPRSVRIRLTLWYASLLAALLLAYAGGVYAWAQHDAIARIDAELESDFEEIDEVLELNERGEFVLPVGLDDDDERDDVPLVEIHDAQGRPLLRLPPGRVATAPTADWRAEAEPVTAQLADGSRARVIRAIVDLGGTAFRLEVGQSLAEEDAALAGLALILLLCVPLFASLAGAAGWFLAGRALAPVARLTEKARRISAERLSDRLPVANPDDELGRLAAAFNDMLQRLDRSFEQLRRFTADASHELRTPLTAMRVVGENALRQGRLDAESREVVGSMLEEVDRLARLVDDLLLLARADAGQVEPRLERCDVAALARDVTEQLGVLAEEKQLRLELDAPERAHVLGNATLLRQVLQNLVDNAIRHGPSSSKVRVVVRRENGSIVTEVADQGPGIPAGQRERIFERFYRVDAARSRAHGGAGLGLAIARWIVDVHRGRIEATATDGDGSERGATFRMRLPAAASPLHEP